MVHTPHAPSPRARRAALAALAMLFAALTPSAASGQSVSGFALNRYEPATVGDYFFANEYPWYSRTRRVAFGITADFARNPLVVRAPMTSPQVVTDNMLVLHAHGAVAFLDRAAITLSMPVSLLQTAGPGSGNAMVGLSAYSAGPAPGDPRLGARVRIFGQSDEDYVSLHVGGQLFLGFIPWSGDEHWVTDEALRGRAYVTTAGRAGPMRYTLSLGYHFRRRTQLPRAVMDGDFFVSAGLALAALDGKLHVGPEFWANIVPGSFGVNNVDATVNAEATLGIAYTIANVVDVGIAGGPGLASSIGTPTFRGLFRVSYTPFSAETAPSAPPDTDGDAVVDSDDQCPTESASPRPDATRPGCPLPRVDTDEDGVFDDIDLCPNAPIGTIRDPGRPGCGLPDADRDGVPDSLDVCRDVPAGDNEDPERPGCADGDDDNDGVRNAADRCRDQPPGATQDPERPGCPAPDSDHDTVPDVSDRCPSQPGIPQSNSEQNGCATSLLSFDGRSLRVSSVILFEVARDRLRRESIPTLEAVAEAIKSLPASVVVEVRAHVDAATAEGYRNRAVNLSQRRASEVHRFLIERGVPAARLQQAGADATQPLVPEQGLRGAALERARTANRRIEFVVVGATPAAASGATTTGTPAASETPAANAAPTASSAPDARP
jgi:OOP family OmpA-OmpF porin